VPHSATVFWDGCETFKGNGGKGGEGRQWIEPAETFAAAKPNIWKGEGRRRKEKGRKREREREGGSTKKDPFFSSGAKLRFLLNWDGLGKKDDAKDMQHTAADLPHWLKEKDLAHAELFIPLCHGVLVVTARGRIRRDKAWPVI
jgi:hypothetical protein